MEASVSTAAGVALEELLEVSPQVIGAVVLERDGGRLVASAPSTSDRAADQLAATCVRIVDASEQARRELGREPVVQVEVATPDGHVFVVTDPAWIVAAVTEADPTVGLVFYDLKTTLRAVREAAPAQVPAPAAAASNGSAVTSAGDTPVADRSEAASGDDEPIDAGEPETVETASGDTAEAAASDAPKSGKWRRRNK